MYCNKIYFSFIKFIVNEPVRRCQCDTNLRDEINIRLRNVKLYIINIQIDSFDFHHIDVYAYLSNAIINLTGFTQTRVLNCFSLGMIIYLLHFKGANIFENFA